MDNLSTYLKQFPLVTYKKGEIIISQGEIPQRAYAVQKGLVKAYSLSDEGNERLVDIKIENEFFPDAWIFNKAESALYFYEALTACQLYALPRNQIVEYIDSNHVVAKGLLDQYITNYTAQMLRVDALTYQTSRDKLLHTLRYLCVRFGIQKDDGLIEIGIPLTHQQLAQFLGLSRETVTKELQWVRKKEVVTYAHKTITVDMSRLSSVIGSDGEDLLLLTSS